MPTEPRCERALFVLGDKWAGKTFQIRHMFRDRRLGRGGNAPRSGYGVPTRVWLSNERLLYCRAQAPQESGEDLKKFYGKIEAALGTTNPRWNIVCPMRIGAGNVPGGLALIQRFIHRYNPERVRIALLSPRQDGWLIDDYYEEAVDPITVMGLVDDIRNLGGCPIVEPLIVDARRRNGLLLSDFFDFT